MAIHSFLKAERGDPDWQFTPEHYFEKEFQMIDASNIELKSGTKELMVLRQTPNDKKLLAKHIKVDVREDSHLDLFILNEADAKLQQIFLYDIRIHEGASIALGLFANGGKLNKHIIQVYPEEGSLFTAYGLMSNDMGGDTEIITKTMHRNRGTVSNQLFLGIAGEKSQTVFQGMVGFDDNGEGSEASVSSINLITGQTGRCFSKPEIYSDCVGTTSNLNSNVETLDPEKIYYLQTRGFSEKQARSIIVDSFKNQVINLIPYNELKEEIHQMYAD